MHAHPTHSKIPVLISVDDIAFRRVLSGSCGILEIAGENASKPPPAGVVRLRSATRGDAIAFMGVEPEQPGKFFLYVVPPHPGRDELESEDKLIRVTGSISFPGVSP